jgi:hypothetical protein
MTLAVLAIVTPTAGMAGIASLIYGAFSSRRR